MMQKSKRFGKTSCLFSECISIKVFSGDFEAEKSFEMSKADSLAGALYTLSHGCMSPQYREATDILRQVLVTVYQVLQQPVRQGVPHTSLSSSLSSSVSHTSLSGSLSTQVSCITPSDHKVLCSLVTLLTSVTHRITLCTISLTLKS